MQREGIGQAVVGHLSAPWHRSCTDVNDQLVRMIAPHAPVLFAAATIIPGWPGWEREVQRVANNGAVAARIYPNHWGHGGRYDTALLTDFMEACSAAGLTVLQTVRFEDARQRHALDVAADLSAAQVRLLVRAHDHGRVVLCCAGRGLIEEIHWSLTPGERERIWYDISWIWGPPQDDLAHLLAKVGHDRFLFGSMWPLRLVQTPFANLNLLPEALASTPLGEASAAFPGLGSE
jgi:predicted TIM-barrel fold metal-dependent hydrolase